MLALGSQFPWHHPGLPWHTAGVSSWYLQVTVPTSSRTLWVGYLPLHWNIFILPDNDIPLPLVPSSSMMNLRGGSTCQSPFFRGGLLLPIPGTPLRGVSQIPSLDMSSVNALCGAQKVLNTIWGMSTSKRVGCPNSRSCL